MSDTVSIEIDGSNAAFEDDPGAEFGRILQALGKHFATGEPFLEFWRHGIFAPPTIIHDINGNSCGYAEINLKQD